MTSTPPHILVCDDEAALADTLLYALRTEGFAASWVPLGAAAVERIRAGDIALCILDVGLPDGSGFERCKEIRRLSDVPVLFLTARADELDRVIGLEIGGDDYVTKPFSPREVVARCKVILKRARLTPSAEAVAPSQHGVVEVDEGRARILWRGVPLDLTHAEFQLLRFLVGRPRRVFSRGQLLELVWNNAQTTTERTVDAHVKGLRQRIKAVAAHDDPIATHRGFGYSFEPPP